MAIPRIDYFNFLFNNGRGIRTTQVDWAVTDAALNALLSQLTGSGNTTFVRDDTEGTPDDTVGVDGDTAVVKESATQLGFYKKESGAWSQHYTFDAGTGGTGTVHELTQTQVETADSDVFGLVSGRRLFQFWTRYDHNEVLTGTTDPSPTSGRRYDVYYDHSDPGAIWWRRDDSMDTDVWFKLMDVSNPTSVLAQIAAQVRGPARTANNDVWPIAKLVSTSHTARNILRIANDGNTIIGDELLDATNLRLLPARMGADNADDRLLAIISGNPAWRTAAQVVTLLSDAILENIADNSDQAEYTAGDLVITGNLPSAAQVLLRFDTDEFELDGGVIGLVNPDGGGESHVGVSRIFNLQNLSANRQGGQLVETAELPAIRQGEQIRFVALFYITTAGAANADLGPHRLSLNQTAPLTTTSVGYVEDRDFIRAGTPLDPQTIGTYAVDGPEMISFVSGQSVDIYLHRGQDGSADADVRYNLQVFALRYGAQGVAGITDYDDLTDKPFLNEDPQTSTNDDKLLVWDAGEVPTIYQPHTTPATNPSFTDRALNAADDLPAGATLGASVGNYADLPQGAGDEFRFVTNEVRLYRWNQTDQVWRDYNEDIFHTQGGERWFRDKAIASAALGAHYHNDGDANGIHICYGSPRVLYTVISFTAGAARETVHLPYGYEMGVRITANADRISHVETNILNGKSIWTGTEAEYTAIATKDDNTLYFQTA